MRNLFFISLLFFSVCSAQARDDAVYNLVSGEFAPYSGEALKQGGIASQVVTQAIQGMGEQASITYLPWRRGYALALKGEYFATYPYSISAERQALWHYSEPLYEVLEIVYSKKQDQFHFDEEKDLYGKTICKPVGYNLFGLKGLAEKGLITIEQPPKLDACFLMMNIGRVDLIITNPETAQSMIHKLKLDPDSFRRASTPYRNNTHHLIVPKNNPAAKVFLKGFNQALKEMREKGRIQDILDSFR